MTMTAWTCVPDMIQTAKESISPLGFLLFSVFHTVLYEVIRSPKMSEW